MHLMLIDGNSVGYAAQAGPKLTAGMRETQGLFGFLGTLRKLRQNFAAYDQVVLWDGKARWRYDIYPGYKDRAGKSVQSDQLRAGYKEIRPEIVKAVHALGIQQALHPDAEADDLAYRWSTGLSGRGDKVIVVTGDKDWIQMVNENCMWFDHRSEEAVTHDRFQDATGVKTPQQFVQMKALMGDTSDTIPGVGGIGEKGAKDLLSAWGNVYDFMDHAKLSPAPLGKVIKRFANNEPNPKTGVPMQDAFHRNMELVDLSRAHKHYDTGAKSLIEGRYDEERFMTICAEHGFNSILTNFHSWLAPFKPQENLHG